MRKTVFFALALAMFIPIAEAQFYSGMTSTRGGRINVFGGIHNGLEGDTRFWGGVASTDYYGYTWYDYSEIKPTTLTHNMGMCLGFDMSVLNERSENFSIGATAGIFGTKNKMHASFDPTVLRRAYSTDVDIEVNQIDIHIGLAGLVYVVPEKVSIDFSLSPGFLFSFGDQVRYNNTPAIPTDTENNTWKQSESASDMGFPNIDVMALARIGASYHFTERMWVGALFQYRLPIVALGFENEIKDITKIINNDLRYADRKHKGYAIMLTWGIDLD